MTTLQIITTFAFTTMLASADIERRELLLEDCPGSVQTTVRANARGGVIDEVDLIAIDRKAIPDIDVVLSAEGAVISETEEND